MTTEMKNNAISIHYGASSNNKQGCISKEKEEASSYTSSSNQSAKALGPSSRFIWHTVGSPRVNQDATSKLKGD